MAMAQGIILGGKRVAETEKNIGSQTHMIAS